MTSTAEIAWDKQDAARDEFIRMEDDGSGLAHLEADEHVANGEEIGRLSLNIAEEDREWFIDGEVSQHRVSAQLLIARAADYAVATASPAATVLARAA